MLEDNIRRLAQYGARRKMIRRIRQAIVPNRNPEDNVAVWAYLRQTDDLLYPDGERARNG